MLHLSDWSPLLVHWTSCKTQLPSRNATVPFLTWVCYVLDWKEIMHIWNELRALKVHCFPTHTVYLFEMKSPSVKEKWPSLRSLKKSIPIKKECTSFQAMWHRMNMSIEYVCGKRMQNFISVHITNCIFCGSVVDEVWERAQVSQVPGSLVGDGTSFPISGKGWLRKNARSKRQIWNLQAD